MIEQITFAILGIIAGTITGLIPGIHSNTIAIASLHLPLQNPQGLAIFIVTMSITNSIVDSIPSIFLGAPSEESSINLLPGHRMLLAGRGLEALSLCTFSSLCTSLFSLLLLPIFFIMATNYTEELNSVIPSLIALTTILMLLHEKNKIAALIVIALSASLGVVALGAGISDPLFALISGFFGFSSLAESIFSKTKIPIQKKQRARKEKLQSGFLPAAISGALALFPGIGPAQAATIAGAVFSKRLSGKGYLMLTSGVNSANLLVGILMLFALEKSRTGMAASIAQIIELDSTTLFILLAAAISAVGFACAIVEILAKPSIALLQKINYPLASAGIAIFLICLVTLFCGPLGLLASISACAIGIFGINSKVQRSQCMAFLLLPTFLIYLGIA
ncbi:MAG TPA: tripartite tricarboxylate transporter permease [archaeon]|nr:tripartite tricarboxylate transporter permease [archaeon]